MIICAQCNMNRGGINQHLLTWEMIYWTYRIKHVIHQHANVESYDHSVHQLNWDNCSPPQTLLFHCSATSSVNRRWLWCWISPPSQNLQDWMWCITFFTFKWKMLLLTVPSASNRIYCITNQWKLMTTAGIISRNKHVLKEDILESPRSPKLIACHRVDCVWITLIESNLYSQICWWLHLM